MKSFTVVEAEQRSEAWRRARAGRLTGSRAADMLAAIKSGEAAARRDLRVQLVTERLTGEPQDDGFVNAAMQRGIDMEPIAVAAYEGLTGTLLQTTGFLAHDTIQAGCSLDGYVGDFDGIVELKCPKSSTHLRYLRGGIVPADYLPQITHNLWISGAAWCDFLSFDDRFPLNLQVFRVRIERNAQALAEYEQKALAFLAEVQREYEAVASMKDVGSVLRQAVGA